ncbi:MAG TPA: DUF4832 domain-containing protein [Nitrospira sp.]
MNHTDQPKAKYAQLMGISLSMLPFALFTLLSFMTVASTDQAVAVQTIPDIPLLTVYPTETDTILNNPGMGFADFHFGFDHPPSESQYPRSTVAYFRWSWAELEPAEGQYNFELIDRVIEQAQARGETLGFRIMAEYRNGLPRWLLEKGVANVPVVGGTFPDYNDPIFLDAHEKLLRAFGSRYGSSPDIDHVDIGSVGCWGEWNMACCQGVEATCKRLYPTEENQIKIIDWYVTYFSARPLVMLHGGPLKYAVSRGAGWRADCFGDYEYFGPDWNHMRDAYEPVLQDPVIAGAWKRGPVQFEVCGVMQDWYDKHFDIDAILKKGLEWHVSVLNAKSSPVPDAWRPRIDAFLKKMGYRYVLRRMMHNAEVRQGGQLTLHALWDNVGVAPMYHPRSLSYRLRSEDDRVVMQWASCANLVDWLPGETTVEEHQAIPNDMATGIYHLDVAILGEDGRSADVSLAIEGQLADRWYRVSQVTIKEQAGK